MYCTTCKRSFPNDMEFCSGCKNPLIDEMSDDSPHFQEQPTAPSQEQPTLQPQHPKYPHPYHNLGGWLGFLVYAGIIASSLVVFATLINFFRYAQFFGYDLIALILGIEFIFGMVLLIIQIKFFTMVKNKNSKFLRYYEWLFILSFSINVLIMLLVGINVPILRKTIPSMIRDIALSTVPFVIWTSYFRKSVRVRTYMGTDAYLKNSMFSKNCIPPEPADTKPYGTDM